MTDYLRWRVAALFVLRNGPYSNLPGVDAYDGEHGRDAFGYRGPWPLACASCAAIHTMREHKYAEGERHRAETIDRSGAVHDWPATGPAMFD